MSFADIHHSVIPAKLGLSNVVREVQAWIWIVSFIGDLAHIL